LHGGSRDALDEARGPLLRALTDVKQQTDALLHPERFASTVDAMIGRADELGATAIFGASEVGHTLAGAMAYGSERLRLWRVGECTSVLLIDGMVAGLAGIQLATHRLRAVGAKPVEALVIGVVTLDRCPIQHLGGVRVVALDDSFPLAA
jgi:hypothetical protein